MARSTKSKYTVPVVLAALVVAAVVIAFTLGGERPAPQAPRPQGEIGLWRCNACADIAGKSWQTCRTVTGRGTEQAARDLVRQRVCQEATGPESGCYISRLNCKQLPSGPDAGPIKAQPR